jgi:Protein of unknown function (DUF3800)
MSDEQQLPLFEFAESVNVDATPKLPSNGLFSDYVVYVDESGDHSLTNINKDYPVFVLAFCIFHKRHYAEKIIPALEKFKFNHFGHDAVVLHEHEIRKQTGDFTLLTDRALRQRFIGELTDIISAANFVLMTCVIDKARLSREVAEAGNPYHIALGICLDGLHDFLQEKDQAKRTTHVLVECRGKKEDAELELEFRRMRDGANRKAVKLPFEMLFVDKKANSSGLQLADLLARPIGINYLRPDAENRAFETLKPKFYCKGGRKQLGIDYDGWGLKVVPPRKAKGPGEPTEAVTPIGNPQST